MAVTSPERSPFYPDVPTVAEAQPGYDVELWWGVLAPAATPKPIVRELNAAIRAIVAQPQMREMFAHESAVSADLDPDQFAQQVRADARSEEHTSELQSLMRNSYAVFCLKKKNKKIDTE